MKGRLPVAVKSIDRNFWTKKKKRKIIGIGGSANGKVE